MFDRTIVVVAAVALLAPFALSTLACGGGPDTVPDQPATEAEHQSYTIVLYQNRFEPNSLEVESGSEVVFENRDPDAHNINIPALDIDTNLDPNESYTHTFETQGDFAVGNRFRDGMKLDLIVD